MLPAACNNRTDAWARLPASMSTALRGLPQAAAQHPAALTCQGQQAGGGGAVHRHFDDCGCAHNGVHNAQAGVAALQVGRQPGPAGAAGGTGGTRRLREGEAMQQMCLPSQVLLAG